MNFISETKCYSEKERKKNQMTEHPQPEFLDGNTIKKFLSAVDGTDEKV